MAENFPACPNCREDYTYQQGALLNCPMCGHEWSPEADAGTADEGAPELGVSDAAGNALQSGDTVTVIRDLKVKGGGGGTVKIGTKVRNIQLLADPVDGHDIDATVPGFGRMKLKSSVVRKAN